MQGKLSSSPSLEDIYEAHADALFGYLLNLSQHEADALDLLQVVFCKLASREDLQLDRPCAYLLRMAHNAFIDHVRHRDAQARLRIRLEMHEQMESVPVLTDPDSNFSPDELLIANQAVRDLDPDQRSVVHLRLWEQLTFEQIAEITRTPKATAASRYRYALTKLRKQLLPVLEPSHLQDK